ncbi:protein of unknown function [Candidatus Filomicrobium marinum]|uniref:Uncharacterized protein n=1 Tax=Candidatus Filomicrobium marinum TaxID=1608628 RepID=A0A0D6JB31_9HYPH|nr:protein of unknown function [Candidatus Filomicrobium marinum]CPR16168.1 protein of unknown function [Candidatus Filomicrobium marinum]
MVIDARDVFATVLGGGAVFLGGEDFTEVALVLVTGALGDVPDHHPRVRQEVLGVGYARFADDLAWRGRIEFFEFPAKRGLADVVEALGEIVWGKTAFLDGREIDRLLAVAGRIAFERRDDKPLLLNPALGEVVNAVKERNAERLRRSHCRVWGIILRGQAIGALLCHWR